jgi:hypothetical protein
MNKLMQTQHQILVSELAKIEKLNELINKKKQSENERHHQKMESYDNTIAVLQQQLKAKQNLINEISVVGGSSNINIETHPLSQTTSQ